MDIEPWTSSIKTTPEALDGINDLTKFSCKPVQDEDLVTASSSVAQRLEDLKITNQTQLIITGRLL